MQSRSYNSPRPSLNLVRFGWFVAFYNVLVIVWGALVRASGSGAGCGNHWPLCNGQVIPVSPAFHTMIEFTHRMMTGGATFLVIALAIWTFRGTAKRHRARKAALWSVFFLVTEALLGAALVLRGWVEQNASTGRVIAQAVHFTNTLLLMAALTLTASFLGKKRAPQSGQNSRLAAWVAVMATIVMGATGALAALADTLFPSPSVAAGLAEDFASHAPVLVRMRWLHPAAAVIGACCVIRLVLQRVRGRRGWDRLNLVVTSLLALQFALGVADVLLLAPAWMQLLHLLGADLYWVALVVLAGKVIWRDSEADGVGERRETMLGVESTAGR